MTGDGKTVAIFALIHVVLITYIVLVAGVFAKIVGETARSYHFLMQMRDWGVWLYVLPLVWSGLAGYVSLQEKPSTTAEVVVSVYYGLVTAVLLYLVIAVTFGLLSPFESGIVDLAPIGAPK